MTDQSKWSRRFLQIAREATTWSKDPDKQVGCVVVSEDRRQLSIGYNGFPAGIRDTEDRLHDHTLKNKLTVHAELNAILNARRDISGWTLYVTEAPCLECAKAMIQAGITRVVCPPIKDASRWKEEQKEAAIILTEANIILIQTSGDSNAI